MTVREYELSCNENISFKGESHKYKMFGLILG